MTLGDDKLTAPLSWDVQSPLHVCKALEEAPATWEGAPGLDAVIIRRRDVRRRSGSERVLGAVRRQRCLALP